ncbi:hypothetical protein DXG03_000738 [Asterophora parasitica]|uniref:Uncharacterized protein n=1 Tax=Asterophora parasitica TaxID=117018 RepID=A0A9P7GAJ6_9AGAR|nr:hypothetical protein DXG03_000738 [Asterophora parasitica]
MDDTGPLSVISMLSYLFRILAALAAPSPHSSHPVPRFALFTTVIGFALAALEWASTGLVSSLPTTVKASFTVHATPFTPRFIALPLGDEATMWWLTTGIALVLLFSSMALLDFRLPLEPPKRQHIHVTACTPPRLVWWDVVRGIGYGLVMRECASSVVAMLLAAIAIPHWLSNLAGLLAFVATIAPALVNRTVVYGVVNSVYLTEAVTSINIANEAEATLCQTPSPRKKKLWIFGSPDHTPLPPPRPRSPLVPPSPQDNTASTAFSDAESVSIHVDAGVVQGTVVDFEGFGSPEHTSSPPRRRLPFVPPSPQVVTVIQHQDVNSGHLDFSFSSDGAEGNLTNANISCPRLVSLYPALMGMLHETIMHIDENGSLVRRPKACGVGIEQDASKDTQRDTGEELVRDGSIALIDMIAAAECKLTDAADLMRELLPDEYAGANVTLSHIARWDGRTVLTENNMEAYALADQGYFREPSAPGPSDDTLSLFTEEDERRCGTWVNGIAQFNDRWSPPRRAEERLKRMAADNDEFGLELDEFGKKLEAMRRAMNGDAAPSPPPTPASVPVLNIVGALPRSEPLPTEPDEEEPGLLYIGYRRVNFPQPAPRAQPVPTDPRPYPTVPEDGPAKRVLRPRTSLAPQPTTATTRLLRSRASVPAKSTGRAPLAPISTNVSRKPASAPTHPTGPGSKKALRPRVSASAPAPVPAPKRPTIAALSRAAKVPKPRVSLATITPSVPTTTTRARAAPRASLPAPSAFKVAGPSKRTPTATVARVVAPSVRPARASLPAPGVVSKIAPAPARQTSAASPLPPSTRARAISRASLPAPAAAKIAAPFRRTSLAPAAPVGLKPASLLLPATAKTRLSAPRPSLPAPGTSKNTGPSRRTSLAAPTVPVTLRPRASSGLRFPTTRTSSA